MTSYTAPRNRNAFGRRNCTAAWTVSASAHVSTLCANTCGGTVIIIATGGGGGATGSRETTGPVRATTMGCALPALAPAEPVAFTAAMRAAIESCEPGALAMPPAAAELAAVATAPLAPVMEAGSGVGRGAG